MNQQESFFDLLNIIPALFWLIVIIVAGFAIKSSKSHLPHYKYYMQNLLAKLFFSLAFALVYILYYGGGDTTAYYQGAVVLNNVFFENPGDYFSILSSDFSMDSYSYYYNSRTGYPPGWIFREPQGFFVVKLMSVISFFTLKSYLAMTFIMAFFTSLATWKLFELVRSYYMNNEKMLAFGVLLLPSVNFWCSGVSKDTVAFIAALTLVYHAFHIISVELKSSFKNYVYAILAAIVIAQVREFILAAIALPMLFALAARFVRILGGGDMAVVIFRSLVLIAGLLVAGRSLILSESEFRASNSLINEAAVIQDDFMNNEIYGDKKYDIGEIVYTPVGLTLIAPMAIISGIFRPFPWEALSVTLLMNGLESIILLYFTFLFFKKKFRVKWRIIRGHEFLIFCLIFIIIIAYMTGLTSGLYGVLVRLRSPLLPFLFILLTIDFDKFLLKEKEPAT